MDAAKAAGAEYIISLNLNVEGILYTKAVGLVSVSDAFTPYVS